MVNVAVQGKTYPSVAPYLVAREKVREFARAVKAEARHFYDVDAAVSMGFNDVVAPPTFAVVVQDATLQQLLADDEADVDFSRVVHGEQRFSYTRPIVAGDELTATLTITAVKQIGGHSMVTASSDITDAQGEHVVTAISSLVVRGE